MRRKRVALIILISVTVSIVFFCGFLTSLLAHEEPVVAVPSPDGRFVALVTVSRAFWDYTVRVYVTEPRDLGSFGSAPSQFLLASESWIKVVPKWEDNRTLIIEYEDRKVYDMRDEPWRNVKFVFRKME